MNATDGLDVINVNMGPKYPQGMLVTQTGRTPRRAEYNFKFTPWQSRRQLHGPGGRHRRQPPELKQEDVFSSTRRSHVVELQAPPPTPRTRSSRRAATARLAERSLARTARLHNPRPSRSR